jgi:hypothetical protein
MFLVLCKIIRSFEMPNSENNLNDNSYSCLIFEIRKHVKCNSNLYYYILNDIERYNKNYT